MDSQEPCDALVVLLAGMLHPTPNLCGPVATMAQVAAAGRRSVSQRLLGESALVLGGLVEQVADDDLGVIGRTAPSALAHR